MLERPKQIEEVLAGVDGLAPLVPGVVGGSVHRGMAASRRACWGAKRIRPVRGRFAVTAGSSVSKIAGAGRSTSVLRPSCRFSTAHNPARRYAATGAPVPGPFCPAPTPVPGPARPPETVSTSATSGSGSLGAPVRSRSSS